MAEQAHPIGGEARGLLARFDLPARLGLVSERRGWAYIMLLPSFLLVLAVVLYPVASGTWLSFHELNLLRPALGQRFVGLKQYLELAGEPVFWVAMGNTVIWVAAGATSQLVLGMVAALALNRHLPGSGLFRVVILFPWLMPTVVAGHMWALLLDSRLGVINDVLVRLGLLASYRAWFAEPDTAMPAVLLVDLWKSFPFFTLLLLAGLEGVPDDLYEAASIDGASPWAKFWQITVPLLTPVIVAVVVLRVIGLVNSPDLMIVLTNGGPGDATRVLSLLAFETAYLSFDFGSAAAISVVMMLILMVFTAVYLRVSGVTRE